MLTSERFVKELGTRLQGATLASIGDELGVTRQCVHRWLKGYAPPPRMVLLLAELLWGQPGEWPADPSDRT